VPLAVPLDEACGLAGARSNRDARCASVLEGDVTPDARGGVLEELIVGACTAGIWGVLGGGGVMVTTGMPGCAEVTVAD